MLMDERRSDSWKVWTPLLFSLILIAGMVLGFNLRDTLRNKRDIITVITRNDRLEEVIDLVKEKYVDTVNNNVLYKDAISGILKSLDPHTVYIPSEEVEGVNDDLEGGFSGIGVEFSIVRDTIEVTSVVENGPSAHAGIEVGDQLIKVGDSVVAGIKISSDRIVRLLKGRQRSDVSVTIKRANGAQKEIAITRDIIPVYSVEASIMLDGVTGFIKINRFSATTADEFSAALKKLIAQGARQLILDLRDNPGGYLDAATSIADNFLDDNKLIVYTKGLNMPKTEYRAGEKGIFENGKLAVLVDEGSASASEILAGAIQDWDRGVIVGRRSFGKGLVQKQYELPDGAALRLTIARYYTPSGRCIQRSFAKGREAYMEDYEKRFETGELTGHDTCRPGDTVCFYTAKRRPVFGGGGIKPDVYVPYDTSHLSAGLITMIYSQELKTAIWDYFIRNRAKLKYKSITDFKQSFNGQERVADNYLTMLDPEMRQRVLKELSKPVNDDYLKLHIKAQVARFLFRDNGYYAVSLKDDEVVNKALDVLNNDSYSKLISGK
jgi:carboxyl-terminal processing protease